MMVVDVVRVSRFDMEDSIPVIETHSLPAQPTQSRRKLIVAPVLNLSADDEDDDDLSDIPPPSPRLSEGPLLGSPMGTATHASLLGTPETPDSGDDQKQSSPFSRVAYDLANYVNTGIPPRRHSISICETPGSNSTKSSQASSAEGSPKLGSQHQSVLSSSKTQRDFLSSAHFASKLDCLSLTLEEVVHIRNVLTKADLDALPLDLSIKEDVGKGKICFICMKSRFSFFGLKGKECRLCKRIVCKKCLTKMRIPTEHFSNIPVAMLTPQALSPREEDDMPMSLQRSFYNMLPDFQKPSVDRRTSSTGSVGSAPASPTSPKRSLEQDAPAPCVQQDIKKKQQIRQKTQEIEEKIRGELMCVCLDCKAMVLHVLLSIKHRKEQQPTSDPPRHHLHLDLNPVYT